MGKVEDYTLETDIIELHSQGESSRKISVIFKKRGIAISKTAIQNWINTHKSLIGQLAKQNDVIQNRLVNAFLDAGQQILFMNNAALKIFNEAEADIDRPSMFRALDQMGKNLLLYNQLIGKPESEMDMVRILERLPPKYQEAIKLVHSRGNR